MRAYTCNCINKAKYGIGLFANDMYLMAVTDSSVLNGQSSHPILQLLHDELVLYLLMCNELSKRQTQGLQQRS